MANKNRSPTGVFNENSGDIIQFNNATAAPSQSLGPHVLRTTRLVTIFLRLLCPASIRINIYIRVITNVVHARL